MTHRFTSRADDKGDSDDALFRELADVVQARGGEPMALLTRDAIPGYELEGEVRRGGQGTVYSARQVATNRTVALKVLDRNTANESSRFRREVDLACRLSHPGIVRVYESGETDGRLWYAMEFAEGARLDEYLRDERPALAARLDLLEALVEAVAYAHRQGVIHRDLKPANVLVDCTGAPRIVDFGLALASESTAGRRLTATGEFLGTIEYASPEQVRGAGVDTRTDVHALGILAYEVLTGRLPWKTDGGVTAVLRRIEEEPPREPTGVDDELATVLRTALAKDPEHRYASADALLRDLRHYRASEPLEARRHSLPYVLRRAAWRHRVGLGVAAVVLLVLGAATFAVLRERWNAEQQAEQTELVRQLMKDVVGAGGAMSDDATRMAVLEDTVARLDGELEAAPDVQAAVLLALGESHYARLRHGEADRFLRRAVERFREADDEVGATRALAGLARVLAERGDTEAVEAAEEVVAWHRAREPEEHPDVAVAERLLARTLIARLPERDEDRERARAAAGGRAGEARSGARQRARRGRRDRGPGGVAPAGGGGVADLRARARRARAPAGRDGADDRVSRQLLGRAGGGRRAGARGRGAAALGDPDAADLRRAAHRRSPAEPCADREPARERRGRRATVARGRGDGARGLARAAAGDESSRSLGWPPEFATSRRRPSSRRS